MGLSASQGRLLLLTARRSDLEYRAQQISQKRLVLSQQLEEISLDYENATSNRQMKIDLYLADSIDDTSNTQRQTNLTYADLVSGTVGIGGPGSELSGIQAYSRTSGREYQSNTPYRLVSIDGAIVVSSKEEIPMLSNTENKTETNATKVSDTDDAKYGGNLYKTTHKKDGEEISSELSVVAANDSDLYKLIKSSDAAKNIEIDEKNGIVKYTDDENRSTYYKISDGSKYDETPDVELEFEDGKLYKTAGDVPKNTNIKTSEDELKLVEGNDGVYTLKKATAQQFKDTSLMKHLNMVQLTLTVLLADQTTFKTV